MSDRKSQKDIPQIDDNSLDLLFDSLNMRQDSEIEFT
jgi:hypothetical protein